MEEQDTATYQVRREGYDDLAVELAMDLVNGRVTVENLKDLLASKGLSPYFIAELLDEKQQEAAK